MLPIVGGVQVFKIISIIVLLFICERVSGQTLQDTLSFKKLSAKFEIGFTPRFSGFRSYKTTTSDTAYFHKTQWLRLQGGYSVFGSNYLHLMLDYFHVRTNLPGYEPELNAFGYGIQYSYKFENAIVELKPFRLYKKQIFIRWYPEISMAYGKMNLVNPSFLLSGLKQADKYYGFIQYGIAFNFYINQWCNLTVQYFQEYFPHLKHDPYRYYPLQLKIVVKL